MERIYRIERQRNDRLDYAENWNWSKQYGDNIKNGLARSNEWILLVGQRKNGMSDTETDFKILEMGVSRRTMLDKKDEEEEIIDFNFKYVSIKTLNKRRDANTQSLCLVVITSSR